ncbi:MAG: CD225/dispanin family protein [Tepidisphaerales bacterium]
MFCQTCGAQVDPNVRFCPRCGAATAPVQTQPVQYATPPQYQYAPPPQQFYPPGTVPNYLAQAILVTVLCCMPFGIVAIVKASQVNSRLAIGDWQGAVNASGSARTWCWVAFACGLVGIPLWFLVAVAGA